LIAQQKDLPEIPKIVWMVWHNDQLPTSMALNISKSGGITPITRFIWSRSALWRSGCPNSALSLPI